MIEQESLLVTLVRLVNRIPLPPATPKRGRGRPKVYADRLILQALGLMVTHLEAAMFWSGIGRTQLAAPAVV